MIEFVSGKLSRKIPGEIVINVNGVGYKIYISLNTYDKLPNIDEDVFLDTYYNVSENSHDLYGFNDILEKDLFVMLISVSGIGPKTAIVLLSAVSPNDFKNRLIGGEVKMLTDLPGIGPKTAKRIIIELKDKFIKSNKDDLPIEDNYDNSDAYYALINLGFKSNKVKEVINKIVNENATIDAEQIVKEALKKLK